MPRVRLSLRLWMSFAFVMVVAVAMLLVWRVFLTTTDSALEKHAEESAVGHSTMLATRLAGVPSSGIVDTLVAANRGSRTSAFVLGANGRTVAADAGGRSVSADPLARRAQWTALAGRRFIDHGGGRTIVGLPLLTPASGALVTVTSTAPSGGELAIIRRQLWISTLVAFLAAGGLGVMVAALVNRRIMKLQLAAKRIAAGDFGTPIRPGFDDEIGDLERVTDHMRAELAEAFDRLDSQSRRVGRMVSRLRQGVIVVDRDMAIGITNDRARRIFPGAATGARLEDACPELVTLAHHALQHPDDPLLETAVTLDDRSFRASAIPPERPDEGVIVVLRDLTEESRRERAAHDFVANASHELRTPVTAIVNVVEVLESGAIDDPAEARHFLTHLRTQSARLRRLTAALLTLAKAEALGEAPLRDVVQLAPVLQEVVDEQPGGSIELSCAPSCALMGHSDLVHEIFSNLVANAVKHSGGGMVAVLADTSGEDVIVQVRNAGPAIPLAEQEYLFDRFVRGRSAQGSGYGLGLAIVRAAVAAMRGTVDVRSDSACTCFTVMLPACALVEAVA